MRSDFEHGKVDTSVVGYGLLVCLAVLVHRFLRYLGIDGAHILRLYVDVVEEDFAQALQYRRSFRQQGEEFVDDVYNHVAEINASFVVQLDEACICPVGAYSCAEGEYASAFLLGVAVDVASHFRGNEIAAVGNCFKNACE